MGLDTKEQRHIISWTAFKNLLKHGAGIKRIGIEKIKKKEKSTKKKEHRENQFYDQIYEISKIYTLNIIYQTYMWALSDNKRTLMKEHLQIVIDSGNYGISFNDFEIPTCKRVNKSKAENKSESEGSPVGRLKKSKVEEGDCFSIPKTSYKKFVKSIIKENSELIKKFQYDKNYESFSDEKEPSETVKVSENFLYFSHLLLEQYLTNVGKLAYEFVVLKDRQTLHLDYFVKAVDQINKMSFLSV